jgi:biotin carboxyl carrier protein
MGRNISVNCYRCSLLLEASGNNWHYEAEGDINGQGALSVAEGGAGVWSVLLNGRSFEIRSLGSANYLVNGNLYNVQIEDPRDRPARSAAALHEGRHVLSSPMPGRVVKLLVVEGQAVEAGQGVVVVEAMKMQNEMKAARSGIVTALPVREGVAVAGGETLAVIE